MAKTLSWWRSPRLRVAACLALLCWFNFQLFCEAMALLTPAVMIWTCQSILRGNLKCSLSHSAGIEMILRAVSLLFMLAAVSIRLESLSRAARSPPWVPTSRSDLHAIFELAHFHGISELNTKHYPTASSEAKSSLLELGSGDGRNLVEAARWGMTHVYGIELNPFLFTVSWFQLRALRLDTSISVRHANILALHYDELPRVDLVLLYLSREMNEALAPLLRCAYAAVNPPVRVLSIDFPMPDDFRLLRAKWHGRTNLLVYEVPKMDVGAMCIPKFL